MLKKLTKGLSLLLVFCLMVSLLSVGALAVGEDEAPAETPVVEEEDSVLDEAPVEETDLMDDTSEDVPDDIPSEPVSDENPNAVMAMFNTDEGVAAASLTMGTKPADGTTTGNPFVKGTGGSNSFRIPAMVTLNNGTIVAAADARWNTTYDGGGLDTIVSYSTNNGAGWNYTFANYLGDNGNTYNSSGSTAFIDPALATDGETVYMLCDLYPYGVALNGSDNTSPSTAVGFNSDGTLKLAANGSSTYDYYLKDGQIYDSGNNVVSGYTVDAYFNITGTDGTSSNLFFSDSPYQVVRTGYLYLTKSTDGGKTWSVPTLIPNVKTSSEQVCLVGPGRGLVTGGKIIFPVYSYNGSSSSQRMGFIYSTNGGASWTRVDSSINWSSESAVVELSDGTLRFFYRNGTAALCYADYSWTNGWGSAVNTGIATNSNTQISAISYSKTVDGKQVILVSCPTGSNSNGSADSSARARLNGKIFVGYVNSDNTMSWQSDKAISVTSNNSQFMYSCLTELSDGKVAILYENQESAWGTGDNCYYTMDFKTYDLGLISEKPADDTTVRDEDTGIEINFGSAEHRDVTIIEKKIIPVLAGKTYVAYDISVSNFSGTSATVTIPLNDTFADKANLYAVYIDGDGNVAETIPGTYDTEADTFTFEAKHFSTYAVLEGEDKVTNSGGTATSYVLDNDGLDSGSQYLIVYKSNSSATSGVAINTSKGIVNVTIDGNNATLTDDASAALWTYTAEDQVYSGFVYDTYYYLSNGSQYIYTTRSGNFLNRTYTLKIDSSKTRVVLSNQGNGSYYVTNANSNSYVAYNNSWGAQSSGQPLYFYKYTEGTQNWTVDPALQEQRIASLTVTSDGYTEESWNAYQDALTKANAKLSEVMNGSYASENEAESALKELTDLVDALETAKNNLVKPVSIAINYKADNVTVKTEMLEVAEDATSVTLPSMIVGSDGKTYDVANTTLTLNLPATTTYSVTVTERVGTALTIKENETTTISVELEEGQTVEWSSADSSYVGVAGKYDTSAGAYTNKAILAGQNVTSSPVVVTATIKNADGTVAGVQKWLVTVTKGDADTNTNSKGIYFNIATIENCTVYYSVNGGELIPVNGTGVTTGNWTGNGTYKGHFNIMFFAAPDEGYALTYMSISGSADQYYTLSNGNPDGTGSDAWPFKNAAASTIPSSSSDSAWKTVNGSLHGFRWALLEGNMTIDQMKVLFSNAIALGCDGATTITKNGNEGMGSASSPTVCKFVAQKLPTVEKTITNITHDGTEAAYTDGMKVEIGDTIKYSVVVTRYATNAAYGTITYDNEKLTDALTNNNGISNPDMGTSTTSDKTYTYTTSLKVTMDNYADVVKDGKITNTADFSYSYSSQYSAGSLISEASAVADITMKQPEYVIDFGLPVTIDLATELGDATIESGTAKYGTITPTGKSFTYTPNQTLKGVDYVTLTLANGQSYGVTIYPATTVYYEEGFATLTGFTGGSKGTGTQATQIAGKRTDEYGYDAAYNAVQPSNNSQATSSAKGDTATFTFTGTGVDIYANTSTNTGTLIIQVKNTDGANVKLLWVDTAMRNGSSDATDFQAVTGYNVPVASITGLTHGNYTVTITNLSDAEKTDDGEGNYILQSDYVALDGFRVYGTLATEPDFYTTDKEDNPTFIELRDQVLAGLSVTSKGSGQVNAALPTDTTVAVVASSDEYTQDNVNDLLTNGPKNEIYLQPGQALVLKITTAREVQIGLKALNAATTYTINNESKSISTSTDMFYTVLNKGTSGEQTITIANTGSGILSVTKLKVCDDPNAALVPLTEDDLADALASLGIMELEPTEPEVTYADASLTIKVNDASTVLTKNGVAGETATFTAAEIQSAAAALVPDSSVLDDVSFTDVEVVYGASDEVTFTASAEVVDPKPEPEPDPKPSQPSTIIGRILNGLKNLLSRLFRK